MDGVTILPVSVDEPEVRRLLDTDIAVVCVDRRIENARAAELLLRRLSEPDRSPHVPRRLYWAIRHELFGNLFMPEFYLLNL